MTELERCKKALEVAKAAMKECSEIIVVQGAQEFRQRALGEINAILNPPPAVETVDVDSWCTVDKNGSIQDSGITEERAKEIECTWSTPRYAVRLIGSFTREVQKVERTLTAANVLMDDSSNGVAIWPHGSIPEGAMWGEVVGKRGTLTFTWEE